MVVFVIVARTGSLLCGVTTVLVLVVLNDCQSDNMLEVLVMALGPVKAADGTMTVLAHAGVADVVASSGLVTVVKGLVLDAEALAASHGSLLRRAVRMARLFAVTPCLERLVGPLEAGDVTCIASAVCGAASAMCGGVGVSDEGADAVDVDGDLDASLVSFLRDTAKKVSAAFERVRGVPSSVVEAGASAGAGAGAGAGSSSSSVASAATAYVDALKGLQLGRMEVDMATHKYNSRVSGLCC